MALVTTIKSGIKACAILAACLLSVLPARASTDVSALCDAAAQISARKHGVPISVLRAISLTETGRTKGGTSKPWPWTVNMEGKGKWFEDRTSATAYVMRHYNRGARSFDVGCFQLNYKWHGQNFARIEDMFDPQKNADYAATFLKNLYAEKRDWSAAAGAYHSRTKVYADKYRKRFDRFRSAIMSSSPTVRPVAAIVGQAVTPNNFPLLRPGQAPNGLGSLVPLGGSVSRSIFARTQEADS